MKRLLLAVIACLCLSPLQAEPIPRHGATTPIPQNDPDWKERYEKLNALPRKGEAQVVFLGDSITQLWEAEDAGGPVWSKYWVPLKAVNLGISGDRTEHVLWRLEHGNLEGLNPKVIVLMIGTNNAGQQQEIPGYRCTPAQTADGIRAILDTLKTKCPRAKILLLAIFPRGEENTDPIRKQNETVNALIKNYADNERVFYRDIGAKFLKPNGDLSVVNMPDMLHLSTRGYKIWTDAILPTVKQMLQPR